MYRLVLLLAFFLFACGPKSEETSRPRDAIIRLMEADSRGLDPQMVSDLASTRVAADL